MILTFENIRIILTLSILTFFLIAFIFYCLTNRLLLKRRPIKSLFWDFKAKMWMTLGLGAFFFGLYLLFVWIGSHLMDQNLGLTLFFKVYESPISYVYLGLFIFICFSLFIYLARMFIKYIFLTRKK